VLVKTKEKKSRSLNVFPYAIKILFRRNYSKNMISNEVKIQAGAAVGIASLMTWLNCRPLGIIFFTILLGFSYKQIYPNARVQIPHEVQNNLNTVVDNFANLRKDKPGAFCVIISGGLVTLAIAGHLISGSWLILGTLIGILFLCAKYKIKLVYGDVGGIGGTEHDKNLTNFNWNSQTTDHEIDEFLPDVSDELNISLLKQVAEQADVSNFYKNSDDEDKSEVPSDLLLTSDKIPEIEDEEVTYPSGFSPMQEDVELPRSGYKVTYDPFTEGIDFQNRHGADSSDSDDSISRGLSFQDVTLPDAPSSGVDGQAKTSSESGRPLEMHGQVPQNSISSQPPNLKQESSNHSPTWNIVNNLWDAVNSVVPSGQPVATSTGGTKTRTQHRQLITAELSSDESDFELLDTEDVNT
jgi:hypothetical protein